jgi:hypothetical protein
MKHILSEIFPFLEAVLSRWQIWLSGSGFGGAVVIAVALFDKWFDRTLSKKAHFGIFFAAFFVGACFLSWVERDDAWRAAQNELETQKHNYAGQLQQAHDEYGNGIPHCNVSLR